jgi:hypothetical protein
MNPATGPEILKVGLYTGHIAGGVIMLQWVGESMLKVYTRLKKTIVKIKMVV